MKLITVFFLLPFLLVTTKSVAQMKAETFNTGLIIKMLPFQTILGTVVYGKMRISEDSLFFSTKPCSESAKKRASVLPCNAHLFKPMALSFGDIKKINRRAFLFLIPNRIFIKTKTNETYLFITYKRKMIIRKYQTYLATSNEVIGDNKIGSVK